MLKWRICAPLLLPLIVIAGCTQIQLGSHLMKKSGLIKSDCLDPGQGSKKVGRPYKINGINYVPISSSNGYKSTGIASWYGADFHGRKTANGECYDMYAMTAAHPILPMPTKVRVTNLENNKSVILIVNDRGPFARGRLIDLSYAAAKKLDMAEQGTAPVLVEALDGPHHNKPAVTPHKPWLVKTGVPDIKELKTTPQPANAQAPARALDPAARPSFTERVAGTLNSNTTPDRINDLPPPPNPAKVPVTSTRTLVSSSLFVQTGAFGSKTNAERQAALLRESFDGVDISQYEQPGGPVLHRVRFGPFGNIAEADAALLRAVRSGFQTAVVVAENK